jgi:hypothetical protein
MGVKPLALREVVITDVIPQEPVYADIRARWARGPGHPGFQASKV